MTKTTEARAPRGWSEAAARDLASLLPYQVTLDKPGEAAPQALLAAFRGEADAQIYARGLASSGDYLADTRFELVRDGLAILRWEVRADDSWVLTYLTGGGSVMRSGRQS